MASGSYLAPMAVALGCCAAFPCRAQQTGAEIAEKVYKAEAGKDFEADMLMRIVRADGSTKERRLRVYRKSFGAQTRALMVFRSPADVKGTAFLMWSYPRRESDLWLYLPALRQTTRIAASEKATSFMGSDYCYEDFSKRALEKDEFTLLREEAIGKDPCYVLEARARDRTERFTKRVAWVQKTNFLVLRVDFFDGTDKLVRRFTASNVQNVQGIWTVLGGKMENLQTGGWTTVELSNVKYDSGLPDSLFTKERLAR